MNDDLTEQTEITLQNFRRTFLIYLSAPTDINQNKLHTAGIALSKLAFEKINKSYAAHSIHEELIELTETALKNIKICPTKIQLLERFFNDKRETESAIFAAYNILNTRLITEIQDEVFASIYAIELDGYRLRNIDPEASAACLALSSNLLELSQETINKS